MHTAIKATEKLLQIIDRQQMHGWMDRNLNFYISPCHKQVQ